MLSKDSNIFFVDISSLALKLAFYCIYRFVLSVSIVFIDLSCQYLLTILGVSLLKLRFISNVSYFLTRVVYR